MEKNIIKKETYVLSSGIGAIDIRGDEQESIISFFGVPCAMNCFNLCGSIEQILIRVAHNNIESELNEIRTVLSVGIENNRRVSGQIFGLLRLFKSATYRLTYYETGDEWSYVETDLGNVNEYYPLGSSFVFTQDKVSINGSTVKKYIDLIKSGFRPVVITASTGVDFFSDFVVDGHHKLKAYKQLRISPHIIKIEKVPLTKLPVEIGESILSSQAVALKLYREIKARRQIKPAKPAEDTIEKYNRILQEELSK